MQDEELNRLAAMMAKHFEDYLKEHEKRETAYFEAKVTEIVDKRFMLHETGEHHTFLTLEMQLYRHGYGCHPQPVLHHLCKWLRR